MKIKIFLGEYAYIYRGNIDLREMKEYIKTLTTKLFIIKWKDQEDDLITISKKQDLVYFYQSWTQNQAPNNQSFRLYIQELSQSNQNTQQAQQQQQSQVNSQMQSPSYKYSCIKQYQGDTQYTFGQQTNEQAKSQEIQKDRFPQQITLQSIQEIYGSSNNISNQNLDQMKQSQQYQNEEIQQKSIQQDFNNFSSFQDPYSFQNASSILNMEMKQSIQKQMIDVPMPQDDESIKENQDEDLDELIIGNNNIFCDYCSDKIQIQNQNTIIYLCELCEDFHICKQCYDQNQDKIHMHQLKEIFIQ